jgi:signal transduction histidine kinase
MPALHQNVKIQYRLLTRLTISNILILSVPLFLTGRVLINTAQQSIERTIIERNLEFARRSTRFIELNLKSARDILRSQAKIQSSYELNQNTQDLILNALVSEHQIFRQLSAVDKNGAVIASTSFDDRISLNADDSVSIHHLFDDVGKISDYRTDVYVTDGLPFMDIAEPVFMFDELVAILYAVVDLQEMWDIVDENVVGRRGEAFIFNRKGAFIAHSDPVKVYSRNQINNPELLDIAKTDSAGQLTYMTEEGVEMIAAYASIGDFGWFAMLQQPTSEAFAPASRMRLRVFEFIAGGVLIATLLAYLYTRLILRPVNHLVAGMERFSRGDLKHRIEQQGDDEIGMLAQNFNEMADRLADFQEKMKRTERLETLGKLASVLSHEIRNPLNSMVINMQILKREFSREKVNKERVEKFYSILAAEIKRVDQLVKDFLLIARPAKLEPIRIAVNHILDEVLMMNMADSLKKGVRIERHYSEKTVEVDADPAKLRQVFHNLIINAIQAMPGGGKLVVSIRERASSPSGREIGSGDVVVISFEDTGQGIEKQDLARIFDFYYSTKTGGTGLGLAIVQQIIEEHQGVVNVKSKIDEGTVFSIVLPKHFAQEVHA